MQDASYYLFALLLFLAIVLLLEGGYVWWSDSRGPEAKRIERRLRLMSAGGHDTSTGVSILKQRLLSDLPALQRTLLGVPRVQQLDRLLEQSGLPWSVAKFLTVTLIGVACGLVLGVLLALPPLAVALLCIILGLLPLLHVVNRKRKRLVQIDQQLPDALEMMSRALRAGHAFPSALQMVGDEMPDPIAGEFRIAFDEVNYGIAMKDALLNLAARVPIPDFRYFVIAVLIQRETGGNLAELLEQHRRADPRPAQARRHDPRALRRGADVRLGALPAAVRACLRDPPPEPQVPVHPGYRSRRHQARHRRAGVDGFRGSLDPPHHPHPRLVQRAPIPEGDT